MRELLLISLLILSVNIQTFPQTVISVLCDDTWGPGRYNKVTCNINIAKSVDFARFIQDFPVGLEVAVDNPGSGDFDWVKNQLNMVWMKLPEKRILTFSYFIKPEKSMNGSFTITGCLITISSGTLRQTTFMEEKNISIGGTNGILPERMKSGSVTNADPKTIKKPENNTIGPKVK
jgi:hypothetical protein